MARREFIHSVLRRAVRWLIEADKTATPVIRLVRLYDASAAMHHATQWPMTVTPNEHVKLSRLVMAEWQTLNQELLKPSHRILLRRAARS